MPSAVVGVAGDAEFAAVVHAVVSGAQGDEVPGVGGAVVFPVDDVVHLDVVGDGAAGDAAALVAQDHEAAGAQRDHALGASDGDGDRVVDEHRGDEAVAGDVAADGVGDGGVVVVAAGAVGAQVDVDAEAFASCGRVDVVE